MEHLRIVVAVLLLPTIVEVHQLHAVIRRQVVVAVLLQVLLILQAVPLRVPVIHRVSLPPGRVVTQVVVEVVAPVLVRPVVVGEDKIVVLLKDIFMKNIRLALVIACTLFGTAVVNAQNLYDAARLMGNDLNGTARFVGMGGAMGSIRR